MLSSAAFIWHLYWHDHGCAGLPTHECLGSFPASAVVESLNVKDHGTISGRLPNVWPLAFVLTILRRAAIYRGTPLRGALLARTLSVLL